MAVLAQETESRMNGFTPLALKGDEDRSSGELQQAAQSLPEKTRLSGESGNASWSPTPSQQPNAPEALATPGPAQEGI